jgi:hypothetical protein
MPTAQESHSFSFANGLYSFNRGAAAVVFDTIIAHEIDLTAILAAQTGTLTTRTDNDTGVATLSTGHGLLTGDICDVYWAAGMRYGMDATVSTNAVTLDGGGGDNLPDQDTAVTVVKQQVHNTPLDGDEADIVAVIYSNALAPTAKAHVDFQDSGNATIEEIDLVHYAANGGLDNICDISAGDTNIYTGNPITHVHASHNSTSAGKLYILAGVESA